jgi:hypothetical protein
MIFRRRERPASILDYHPGLISTLRRSDSGRFWEFGPANSMRSDPRFLVSEDVPTPSPSPALNLPIGLPQSSLDYGILDRIQCLYTLSLSF